MPEGVLGGALIDDRALIFTQNAERCDVHDMATLERRKSLVAAAPIVGIGGCPGGIVLQTQTGLEVFDATTLERRSRHAGGGPPPLKFSPPEPHAGISIDEATGTVTVEREPVLDEAVRLIEKLLGGQPVKDGSCVDAYRTMVAAGAARRSRQSDAAFAGCRSARYRPWAAMYRSTARGVR